MLELFKKDVGMCKMLLVGGALAVTLPYVLFALYCLYESGISSEGDSQFWGMSMMAAGQFSIVLTIASFPFLGGYIVAGERRERTAEFLAYLPPKRSTILLSKILVCLAWTLFTACVFIVMFEFVVPSLFDDLPAGFSGSRDIMFGSIAVIAAMFGVSWMLSCMIKSPVFAIVGGICSPFFMLTAGLIISVQFEIRLDNVMSQTNTGIAFAVIAVVSFVTGWIVFLKRVEP